MTDRPTGNMIDYASRADQAGSYPIRWTVAALLIAVSGNVAIVVRLYWEVWSQSKVIHEFDLMGQTIAIAGLTFFVTLPIAIFGIRRTRTRPLLCVLNCLAILVSMMPSVVNNLLSWHLGIFVNDGH